MSNIEIDLRYERTMWRFLHEGFRFGATDVQECAMTNKSKLKVPNTMYFFYVDYVMSLPPEKRTETGKEYAEYCILHKKELMAGKEAGQVEAKKEWRKKK